MSAKLAKHQVIPLRERVKQSKLVCSFKDGFIIPINNKRTVPVGVCGIFRTQNLGKKILSTNSLQLIFRSFLAQLSKFKFRVTGCVLTISVTHVRHFLELPNFLRL